MFKLPHVSTYEKRWQRRLMILVNTPLELVRQPLKAIVATLMGAYFWWKQ